MRRLGISGLVLGSATVFAGIADAQAQVAAPLAPRVPRPTVSPYLSLLNRNNSTAFNYYQIYRPQRRFQQAYEQLGTDLNRLQSRVNQGSTVEGESRYLIGPTGHPTSFMNYGSYYPGAAGSLPAR